MGRKKFTIVCRCRVYFFAVFLSSLSLTHLCRLFYCAMKNSSSRAHTIVNHGAKAPFERFVFFLFFSFLRLIFYLCSTHSLIVCLHFARVPNLRARTPAHPCASFGHASESRSRQPEAFFTVWPTTVRGCILSTSLEQTTTVSPCMHLIWLDVIAVNKLWPHFFKR